MPRIAESPPPSGRRRSRRAITGLALLTLLLVSLWMIGPMPHRHVVASAKKPSPAEHGLVVSVSAPASEVGVDILKQGGNAVDAAVATAFALAVTYPAAGNIGGGGFMVVHPGDGGDPLVIEYRETAPAAATPTMFTKDDSWYSCKAVGVPGTVRGLALAHQKFGKLPWKKLVTPAVKLAEDGFVIGQALASSLNWIVASSGDFLELQRVLGKNNGSAEWKSGWCNPIWPARCDSSPSKVLMPSIRASSPIRLRPR